MRPEQPLPPGKLLHLALTIVLGGPHRASPVAVRYAVSGLLLALLGVTCLLNLSWDVMGPLTVMWLGAALTDVRRRHFR